jgi:transcriptional regulator with PAS, ATPase and Fis domain
VTATDADASESDETLHGEVSPLSATSVPHRPYTLAVRRDSAEAEVILTMLKETPTKAAAAAKLGISERTLRYKLARYRESGLLAVNS